MTKPYDRQDCGGSYCNVPVAHDGTGTPVTSPIAGGATGTLIVPATAARLNLLAVGTTNATVTIKKGATAKSGTITIPVNTQVHLDCAGMGVEPFPDTISVVAGASTPVSFWFDCTTTDGE